VLAVTNTQVSGVLIRKRCSSNVRPCQICEMTPAISGRNNKSTKTTIDGSQISRLCRFFSAKEGKPTPFPGTKL